MLIIGMGPRAKIELSLNKYPAPVNMIPLVMHPFTLVPSLVNIKN
jgi:hypothetical protein